MNDDKSYVKRFQVFSFCFAIEICSFADIFDLTPVIISINRFLFEPFNFPSWRDDDKKNSMTSSTLFPYKTSYSDQIQWHVRVYCRGVLSLQNVKRYGMTRYFVIYFMLDNNFMLCFFGSLHIAIIINYSMKPERIVFFFG